MNANVVQFNQSRNESKPALNLPEPRVWSPQHLADFLGVSVHWIYRRTGNKAVDAIPRIKGVGKLRFDTQSPKFQDWMRRHLDSGYIDSEVGND